MTMSAKSFFHLVRELVLGFGLAVLIPLIAHYIVQVVHPQPPYALINIDKEKYTTERAAYENIYFYITAAIGLACLAIGALIPVASLGIGFIIGGIACLTAGYVTFWGQLQNMLKLGSLLAGFIIILALGYRFFRQREG